MRNLFSTLSRNENNNVFLNSLSVFLLTILIILESDVCFSDEDSRFDGIHFDGNLSLRDNEFAASDYGNQISFRPLAVLFPGSVSDVATTIKLIYKMGPHSPLTVAARGNGHSVQGQSQAPGGVVINMKSLGGNTMKVQTGPSPYVDVSAGELWIDVLNQCLKSGLAPKSWTDYLYLTVGGTLSNAGISGEAFRHGPQINNVLQLEVITGLGDVITCSDETNADLFYSILGGLGQFGIITRARISLEPAPQKVKYITVLYTDVGVFIKDQEHLISAKRTFDYIEGFVIVNQTGTFFVLEVAKYFNPDTADSISQEIQSILSELSYIPSTLSELEQSYLEFLDRVHRTELELQQLGLWDIPHAWLNLLIPGNKIQSFVEGVFGKIINNTNNDPVLIYPVNKSKFDNRTSFVPPDDDVFYMIALLFHANASSIGIDGLEFLNDRNKRVLDFIEANQVGAKEYLPQYSTQEDWKAHFGPRWDAFVQKKITYDPLAILSPGQRIFQKGRVRL
ncbi:oxidase [Lithospermum erythrorhizon]|uniref:cytokinin dehydrogenase n=1 Tax=Lithospermum erythrorhizon TaxID=34254 RepID=A0AAV3RI60_LITER